MRRRVRPGEPLVGGGGAPLAAAAIGSIPGDTSLDRIGVYRIVDGRMHCRRTIRG